MAGETPLTVGALRRELNVFGDDVIIIVPKDGTEMSFVPLSDVGVGRYLSTSEWEGDLVDEDFLDDTRDGFSCVVLWPGGR